MTQTHIIRTYDTTGMKRYEKARHVFFHVFSCFLPDVGWLLATDFSKGWKTSEFAQKVAPFALLLCQEAAFSPQNREAPRSTSVLLKSHLTRCFPMICPIKSNQFSDSKINGFSFVFWLSTIARSAKQQDRELEPPTWEDGEDDRQPCRRKKPNLQGYGPPSEVPNFFHFRFFQ